MIVAPPTNSWSWAGDRPTTHQAALIFTGSTLVLLLSFPPLFCSHPCHPRHCSHPLEIWNHRVGGKDYIPLISQTDRLGRADRGGVQPLLATGVVAAAAAAAAVVSFCVVIIYWWWSIEHCAIRTYCHIQSFGFLSQPNHRAKSWRYTDDLSREMSLPEYHDYCNGKGPAETSRNFLTLGIW